MKATAIDLFSGAGGATEGLIQAGCDVRLAVECDNDSIATYRANFPDVALVPEIVETYTPARILNDAALRPGGLDIITACPPCQGFSTLGKCDPGDTRNDYVATVGALTVALKPRILIMENVPGLEKDARSATLMTQLRGAGYGVNSWTFDAAELCVPQHRRRFILIAVKGLQDDDVVDPRRNYLCARWKEHPHNVKDVLGSTGAPNGDDALHTVRVLPRSVLDRVRKIPHDGGSRSALPRKLQLACHQRLTSRGAGSIYGRLAWSEPAPTMTTRCTTPACGRFLHPTEDRPITLREAAAFQTFATDRVWKGGTQSVARQIGNAVPVRLARVLASHALRLADAAKAHPAPR